MLDYQPGPVDRFRMHWTNVDEFCQDCSPPVPDFAMARLRLPASATVDDAYRLPKRSNASILLVLQGQATSAETEGDLSFGQVLFLKAGQQLTLKVKGEQDVIVYQAFANVWAGAPSHERRTNKRKIKGGDEKKAMKASEEALLRVSSFVTESWYLLRSCMLDEDEYKTELVGI